jgi:pyruvate kinase
MRRARIICTIGPSSRDAKTLERLVETGMDVARLNFSHGTKEEHRGVLDEVRRLAEGVAVMQDLEGPKIRIGELRGGRVRLRDGESYILTTRKIVGDDAQASVTYDALPSDASPGDHIYVSDGIIHLTVEKIAGSDVHCRVVHGGVLTSRKGVNLPGMRISTPALTDKDRDDLESGLAMGVDYVALSFVRSAREVRELKKLIAARKSPALVVSKIEKREAVEAVDEIIEVSDALMIARGDLGVEIPTEDVPVVQKSIISKCRARGKPVITATQMLESMVTSERPTRAEASDVANAVIDGSDAVMLSEETAVGQFPVESVAMMARIASKAEAFAAVERSIPIVGERSAAALDGLDALADAVAAGAVQVAVEIGATAIACLTHTGRTARMIAKRRPRAPVCALTAAPAVIRQLGLVWGVKAIPIDRIDHTETIFAVVRDKMKGAGFSGKIVLTAGIPTTEKSPTNTVHVISL